MHMSSKNSKALIELDSSICELMRTAKETVETFIHKYTEAFSTFGYVLHKCKS